MGCVIDVGDRPAAQFYSPPMFIGEHDISLFLNNVFPRHDKLAKTLWTEGSVTSDRRFVVHGSSLGCGVAGKDRDTLCREQDSREYAG